MKEKNIKKVLTAIDDIDRIKLVLKLFKAEQLTEDEAIEMIRSDEQFHRVPTIFPTYPTTYPYNPITYNPIIGGTLTTTGGYMNGCATGTSGGYGNGCATGGTVDAI